MQTQRQKKVARACRVAGSIVLYRPAVRSLFKAKRSPVRVGSWWNMVLGVPLFLRTLIRLVIACPHRHKGPPITLREPVPSNLPGRADYGRGAYITCLDCGQKFAYDHETRRMVDFWGTHDPEALAGIRRKINEFFSPVRGLSLRVPISELAKSMHRLGLLIKGH
jgi:hypothetical protein